MSSRGLLEVGIEMRLEERGREGREMCVTGEALPDAGEFDLRSFRGESNSALPNSNEPSLLSSSEEISGGSIQESNNQCL